MVTSNEAGGCGCTGDSARASSCASWHGRSDFTGVHRVSVSFRLHFVFALLAVLAGIMLHPAVARAETGEVRTVWRLLDYVAVDYAGAVSNGRVTSATEYAEMAEFSR